MKNLDPKAKWLFFIQSFISLFLAILLIVGWVVPMFVTFSKIISDNSDSVGSFMLLSGGIVLIVFIVTIILGYLWAHLVYENYKYELTDMGFKKEEGVIFKKYITIPYERIQNVDIYRGILARMMDLSDLHIQTAGMSAPVGRYGSGGTEGRIIGISQSDAELLRDELIKRARGFNGQGI